MTEGRERSGSGDSWLGVAALVVLAVVGAALVPTLTSARPANEVPVGDVGANATDPTAESWTAVPSVELALASAPSGLPQASNVSTTHAKVRAATNDSHVFVRVSWPDATADRNASDLRAFADAVAVQLPENESARPPIAMGGTSNRVNVWYWAGGSTEELLAGGAGTTTSFEQSAVDAEAVHEDGEWHVAFTREAEMAGNRTDLSGERDVDVAVAVWNGSYDERAGRKAVSEWQYLAMGPGPQGPPYETILWTVAGLAVLFVAVVTIEGVRRTRGEPA
ncbi:ethylbenzene dehydrogenase-related protein [Halosimplex pelagicum]|uniref:DMSO reductase n=1 Tax=Halosimplex pelagicum TaxID=869886 RepID=A0A7D5TCI7_9EURY|nr:ethylbenzene dehydrogenase-related protein [Halosimplex pelagicum]QLH82969.1 DMSO reductase [Halosimplex pelagicum]